MRNSSATIRAVLAVLVVATLSIAEARAGKADVVEAAAKRQADGSYVFVVTVRHADEGFEHFADRYDVVALDGMVIASRMLAHDNGHGVGGREVKVRVGK